MPTKKEGHQAAQRAFEKLQKELESKKAGLKKVALRLAQGLDARETRFFQHEGTVTDERQLIDYGERRLYSKLVIDVFGATSPSEHVFPDKHGEPQDITGLSNLELATKLMNLAMDRKKAAQEDGEPGATD